MSQKETAQLFWMEQSEEGPNRWDSALQSPHRNGCPQNKNRSKFLRTVLKQPRLEKHDPTVAPRTNLSRASRENPTAVLGDADQGSSVAKTSGAGAHRGTSTGLRRGAGSASAAPREPRGGSPRTRLLVLPLPRLPQTASLRVVHNRLLPPASKRDGGERGKQRRGEDGGQRASRAGGLLGLSPCEVGKALLASAALPPALPQPRVRLSEEGPRPCRDRGSWMQIWEEQPGAWPR